MKKTLKIIFFVSLGASIIIGFPIHKHHIAFVWHKIPCIDAIFGIVGTVLLICAKKIVTLFAERKEDFYDS